MNSKFEQLCKIVASQSKSIQNLNRIYPNEGSMELLATTGFSYDLIRSLAEIIEEENLLEIRESQCMRDIISLRNGLNNG